MKILWGALVLVASALSQLSCFADEIDDLPSGHSSHGAAFDEGPRQKPWKMEGIGTSHFPITTSSPEVQVWFDQGNTLLHNFWWFEAERAFRWCLKLDPECAMAYWGLARATRGNDSDRWQDLLKEAVKRKNSVTKRERMYIEAAEKAHLPEFYDLLDENSERGEKNRKLVRELERILIEFPDDDEAKALLVLESLYWSSRAGNEALIQEILSKNAEHPGAHHYRIHNWDGKDGAVALESCEVYGKLSWYSGHANHMPGHIYSGIGMWHEGAIWMDSATRVEKRYMERRMTLPFHNWNYAHNRNYLSFIQEQLGLPSLAIDGAWQLLRAPHDPKYNSPEKGYSTHGEGLRALVRSLVKFERWQEILAKDGIPWGDALLDRGLRAYCESLAYLGTGDIESAIEQRIVLRELEKELEESGPDGGRLKRIHARMLKDLAGRIALVREDVVDGVRLLSEAAHDQWDSYRHENDPPSYPQVLYTVVGEEHLARRNLGLAADCFEKTLDVNPNDAFALSGLARARHALGESDAAAAAYGKLLFVWSDAEPGLRWMESARALGLDAEPNDDSPKPQRNYRKQTLDELGPETWRPYAAPSLVALDAEGKKVTLDEYKGQNVLLVFYLGEECVHCVEQLSKIGEKSLEFRNRNVVLLAASSATPEEHAASLKLGALPFRLLADPGHENARRFHSYDDFEEIELHSTILIDGRGRIRWARTGGDPFTDLDFLLKEIDRINDRPEIAGQGRPTAAKTLNAGTGW